jgi:hypothetical protein
VEAAEAVAPMLLEDAVVVVELADFCLEVLHLLD